MGALLGEPEVGAPLLRALKVMKERLWGWASLFIGAQLNNLKWDQLPGTLRYNWKGLWRWSVSLCGSSMKGTWREGSLAGDPEGYVEKALETGISFHKGPVWGTWSKACLPGTTRAGWRGLWGWSISLCRGFVEGASGGAPSLGTLEDMLRRSPETGISLYWVRFPSEGNLVCGGGAVHIPGTLIGEWRRALVVGHHSVFYETPLQ